MSDSFSTPGTVTHQAPLYMGFPRREYCSSFPGDPPDQGILSVSPALAGRLFTTEPPGKLSAKVGSPKLLCYRISVAKSDRRKLQGSLDTERPRYYGEGYLQELHHLLTVKEEISSVLLAGGEKAQLL